jgi:Fic family protein
MRHAILQRNAINSPDFHSLPTNCQIELRSISSKLPQYTLVPLKTVIDASDTHFNTLTHPLSDHFLALNGKQRLLVRSNEEARVLNWLAKTELGDCDHDSFKRLLEKANSRLTNDDGGWRSTHISMNKDLRGNAIQFPDVSVVSHQLELLRQMLHVECTVPPVFAALSALALLTNCHPFRDGNGRVGRVLFNYALHKGGMPKNVYVPFYEISARSYGGYQIALREAEIRGKWEPLSWFSCKMLNVYRRIGNALGNER